MAANVQKKPMNRQPICKGDCRSTGPHERECYCPLRLFPLLPRRTQEVKVLMDPFRRR